MSEVMFMVMYLVLIISSISLLMFYTTSSNYGVANYIKLNGLWYRVVCTLAGSVLGFMLYVIVDILIIDTRLMDYKTLSVLSAAGGMELSLLNVYIYNYLTSFVRWLFNIISLIIYIAASLIFIIL